MLARRLAPVQIHWIGFPGTIGGGLVDYIIADLRVIPDGAESFYVERIIRLPRCYQPNNRQRAVAEPLGRADRKRAGSGKRVSVRVDLGGRRIIKKKKQRT